MAKLRYTPKPFESNCRSNDTYASIYMSMILSEAWRDLTVEQQRLYLYCKEQYYGEKRPKEADREVFTMNRAKWSAYGLYSTTNAKGFIRDMTALIEHGFIDCVSCGAANQKKSLYRYSARWQNYGTPLFTVPESVKTSAMKGTRKQGQ